MTTLGGERGGERGGEPTGDGELAAPTRTIGVAVAIPAPWAGELQLWRQSFGDPKASSIPTHVTLLPPTKIDEHALPNVEEHLRKIADDERVFIMELCGTASFLPVSPVVFVELGAGSEACARIEEKVRSGPLHRPVDFAYHPHVTIAHDLPPIVLNRARRTLANYEARFQVEGFSLYEHVDGVWRPVRAFGFPSTSLGEEGLNRKTVKIIDRAKGALRTGRRRFHWLDHLMRANDRNTEVYGSRLAGAITYFAFLSLFPIIAVAFAILGYIVDVYPDAREQVSAVIEENLPGLVGTGSGQLNIDSIADAKSTASVLGLLGLLYSGTGWIDATREALGQVFGLPRDTKNFIVKKLLDVGVLALLGSAILLTVAISSVTTAATNVILGLVGLEGSTLAEWLLRALTLLLAIALNTAIFAVLLARLGGTDTPGKRPAWKRIRNGAILGGIGFEILKLLATYLIGNTLDNPVYGAFAVIVGLLVWMNFVARLLVFAAAWTATEPYSLIPGEGPGGGAGRVTPLSVDTEPVLAVAPPPPPGELIPEGPVAAPDQPAQGQPARGKPARGQPAKSQPAKGQPAQGRPARGQRTPQPVGAARPAEIYAERRRSFAVGAAIGGAAGALIARARSNGRSGGSGSGGTGSGGTG